MLLFMLATVSCLLMRVSCATLSASSHVEEEQSKGFEVASIPVLFNITTAPNKRFKILSQKLAISNNGIVFNKRMKSEQDFVRLNARNGKLTLVKKIDRDEVCGKAKLCAVKLQIIELPDQQLLEMNLVIDDINDNYPIFPQKIIDISLHENFPIGETYNLDAYLANDKDSDMNGEIEYTLTENPNFVLKEYSGSGMENSKHVEIKLLGSIDFENKQELELTLGASDRGTVSKSSSTTLRIRILDVNDNRPIFQQEKYTVTLKENQLPGHEVVTVQADDADSGDLGQVQYYLSHRNNRHVMQLVSVHAQTGVVSLNEKLDRERDDGVKILVEAKDTGIMSQKFGETMVEINIEDVNDNAPVIHVNYVVSSDKNTAYVNENSAIGTFISRVSVTDADDGNNGNVDVTMESSPAMKPNVRKYNRHRALKLNADGFIETTTQLNREECNKYVVVITACDQGFDQRCSSLTLDVVVLDVNEYAPKFNVPTQRVVLREDVNVGITVASVYAEDKDAINAPAFTLNLNEEVVPSKNGKVRYSITSGARGLFAIDANSGKISLIRRLDREAKSEWKLKVVARDGGEPIALESSCDVIVKVDDVNDNSPFFVNPAVNNSLVYASIYRQELITNIRAMDYDLNKNSKLTYKLVSSQNIVENQKTNPENSAENQSFAHGIMAEFRKGHFILNPTTGELRLNFSRANLSLFLGLKKVVIQACDSGFPKLCSYTGIRIMISKSLVPIRDVTLEQKQSPDTLILAISLGAFAVVLAVLITVVAIKCRRQNKEIRSYSIPQNTNRSEYSLGKESDVGEIESLHEDQIHNQSSAEEINQMVKQNEVPKQQSPNIFHSNLLSPSNGLTKKHDKVSSHSDGDSGRGDSEPDNGGPHRNERSSLAEITKKKMMGSMCSVQCIRFGHSDKCWMPSSEVSIHGSSRSVNVMRNEKVYDWHKMKPKLYNSPLKSEHLARYGRSDSDLLGKNIPRTTSIIQPPSHSSGNFESQLEYSRPSSLALMNRRYSASAVARSNNLPLVSNSYRQSPVPRSCQSTPSDFINRITPANPQLNTVYEDNALTSPHKESRQLKYLNDQYRVSRSRVPYTQTPLSYPYRSAC